MLHEYMVTQQLKLQQERIDWVNRNAWMFNGLAKEKKAIKHAPIFSKKQTNTCCA